MFVDIFILLPLLWGGYKGYASGLLSELVGIIHFSIGFAISFKIVGLFFKITQEYVFEFNPNIYPELAFICATGLAFALLATAGKYLKTEIEYDFPGAWDNIIGAGFGVFKYAIVMSFFIWVTTGFGNLRGNALDGSLVYKPVEGIAYILIGVDDHAQLSYAITNAL